MSRALISAIRFLWRATAGNRLQPWRSPYLRWRLETFTGLPAEKVQFRHFLQFALRERGQIGRFFEWISAMKELSR